MSDENNDQNQNDAPPAKPKKVRFDEDQQEALNRIVARQAEEAAQKERDRVAAEWQTKLEAEKARLEAERDKVAAEKAELEKAIKAKTDEKPQIDPSVQSSLEQMQAQLREVQSIMAGIKSERDRLADEVARGQQERRRAKKKDLWLEAMQKANVSFYDPLEAYDLAEKDGYEWDETQERPLIKNKETNAPKLNENGEAMSVLDFVKEFSHRKKYLVKAPTQDGGTGSGEQRTHERTERPAKDYSKMSPEEFEAEVQRVRNQAR